MNVSNVSSKIKILTMVFCMIFSFNFVSLPMTVYASENTENSYDISWIGGEGNGAFDKLEQQVKDTGNSAYHMFMAIGIVGLLLSFIICGIAIAFSGNGTKRGEKLVWLLWIGIGGIVIFGAISFVGLLQSIGGNLM